jgi:type I restriction enzyme, S subunit
MTEMRLRYLLRPREVTNRTELQVLSVYRDYGVIPKDSRSDNFNKTPEDITRYQEVRPGDLVVNKMKAWQGSVGISAHHGIVSPDYLVCSVDTSVNSRFMHHLLRSKYLAAEFGARSKGIRPAQWRLYWEDLAEIMVMLPPLDEQRRIADFLDAETARIDQLLAAKQAQIAALDHLWDSRLSIIISGQVERYGWIALRRAVESIEQGWSPQCDDAIAEIDQWAVLKTSAVSKGEFNPMEHKRMPAGILPELRYQIRDGDILMTRGSGSPELVGVATVARTQGRQLLLSDLLYRIRLGSGWSPEFVTLALGSKPVRGLMALLLRGQSGQTIKLRGEDVRSIEIPAIPAGLQQESAANLAAERSTIQNLIRAIEGSIALLAERRQALITAAVTGQIGV